MKLFRTSMGTSCKIFKRICYQKHFQISIRQRESVKVEYAPDVLTAQRLPLPCLCLVYV